MEGSLPSVDVTPETITDTYVSFILCCNPQFDLDVDTTQLKTNFTTPPRSDSKEFQTWRLFELIKQLDAKEIKTWSQLAQELGVNPPDISKGQSVQKVQQYTVRLKRWMRAMHIDAFFEFLLGKQHVYFTEIPPRHDPYPSGGRDGVLSEEDLVLRALDPSWRPKRGRRRNSETGLEDEAEAERHHRTSGSLTFDAQPRSAHPGSAIPMGAHPNPQHDAWAAASAVTAQSLAPWSASHLGPHSAITPSTVSHYRWQLPGGSSQTPATPQVMSAMHTGSMSAHIDAAFDDEPRSAITPSSRKRRKHGPAVSSAWPSSNLPGTRPRGRPPASRTTQDGPYSTFPADPERGRTSAQPAVAPASDALVGGEASSPMNMRPPAIMRNSDPSMRPTRLSLQVPQHTGGPVRLATPPPPRVVVSGEHTTTESDGRSISYTPESMGAPPRRPLNPSDTQRVELEIPGFAFEALKRVLASDLLRATLTGRQQRLTGEEAKRLADAMLERLRVPRADSHDLAHNIARLTAASWLGVGEQLNVPLGPAVGQTKRINITRFRTDAEGYEEIVPTDHEWPGEVREVFDIAWNVSQGMCNGKFEINGLSLSGPSRREAETNDMHDLILGNILETAKQVGIPADEEALRRRAREETQYVSGLRTGEDDGSVDWKAKYEALQFGTKLARNEMDRFRARTLELIMDVLL